MNELISDFAEIISSGQILWLLMYALCATKMLHTVSMVLLVTNVRTGSTERVAEGRRPL